MNQWDKIESNTNRLAQNSEIANMQLSALLDINVEQLEIQQQQLSVQYEQLSVQNQIRSINQQQLAVNQRQLFQAMQTVKRLDLTNHHLLMIDKSLGDISGILVQQNALIQKSLNRLAAETQELVERGIESFNNGWYKEASKDFELALQKTPSSAISQYFYGKSLYREGHFLESQQAYQKCIYYGSINSPIFSFFALCDLANYAIGEKKTTEARQFLAKAMKCQEHDKSIFVSALLRSNLAEGTFHPETGQIILDAFSDEKVDPEVLLEALLTHTAVSDGLKKILAKEKKTWEEAAQQSLFKRLISHFYRELDDFVYLAPRIRRGFMEAANGKFLSLGDPLSDLLDWTVMIGEQLIKRIELFPSEYPAILRFYRPLQEWNAILVKLNKLTCQLAAKKELAGDQFVEKLNLGLIDLPRMYEDDKILFEMNTEEGDTLALSCYYAIFIRNGTDYFPIPLHEFSILKIDTYPASPLSKGIIVVDPRYGQTLIQGVTGSYSYNDAPEDETHYYIDQFTEAATLLSQIHETIQWAIAHEEELFSIFLLLHTVTENIASKQPTNNSNLNYQSNNSDDGFEVIEELFIPIEDKANVIDDFEVVEEMLPDKWFIARNKRKQGPFAWEDLKKLALDGKIHAGDMVLQEGVKKWNEATSIPGLIPSKQTDSLS